MSPQTVIKSRERRDLREGARPACIQRTNEVVHAAARLWHRSTIHMIVFTAADWRWRVVCNGDRADDGTYDFAPFKEPDREGCARAINWEGGVRNRNGYWAY